MAIGLESERFADLHLHSNFSDGSDAPCVVVARAAEMGLAAMALTDHDTVAGVGEAQSAAAAAGIECLSGVEISTGFRGQEIHVLGYGIDTGDDALLDTFARLKEERETRAASMVGRLRELGVPIELERVKARGSGTIGRMHLAQEVLALGHSSTVQDAFERYLKRGRAAFVPKALLPTPEAIALIHDAGGLAIIAHPGISAKGKRLRELWALDFDGIEALHTRHTATQMERYVAMAEEAGRLVSGGSDCHGSAKGLQGEMGKVQLPWPRFEAIRSRLAD